MFCAVLVARRFFEVAFSLQVPLYRGSVTNEIFYCSRCQTRILGQMFVDGTAFRVRDQVSCENCLGEIIAPLSMEEQQEILLQVKTLKDSQVFEEFPAEPINQEEFFELDSPEQAPATVVRAGVVKTSALPAEEVMVSTWVADGTPDAAAVMVGLPAVVSP